MAVSTIAYLLGVLGGLGGIIATMGNSLSVSATSGLAVIFGSIALLWLGLILESIEASYDIF